MGSTLMFPYKNLKAAQPSGYWAIENPPEWSYVKFVVGRNLKKLRGEGDGVPYAVFYITQQFVHRV